MIGMRCPTCKKDQGKDCWCPGSPLAKMQARNLERFKALAEKPVGEDAKEPSDAAMKIAERLREASLMPGPHGHLTAKPVARLIQGAIDAAHAAGVREGAEAERERCRGWAEYERQRAVDDMVAEVADAPTWYLRRLYNAIAHPQPAPVDSEPEP